MARTTLTDVARHVGVSAKTVSNVVNGTGMVSSEVRARVQRAIDELNYRPNQAARNLRSGFSGLVAMAVPDLREPYFAEVASGFFIAAQRRALSVIIAQTAGDQEAERRLIDGMGMPAIDGIVLSPLALTPEDLAQRKSSVPLVLIGEHGSTLADQQTPHVGVDNVAAAAAATRLLIAKGRRHLAVIGVQENGRNATSLLRFEGFRQALLEAGLVLDERLIGTVTEFNRAEGSGAAAHLLDSGAEFDGLFCFSDTMAFGALYTLASRGVRVPTQVALAGFDAIEEGRYSVPPFATVDTNITTLAETALGIIVDGGTTANRSGRHVIPFSVLERAPEVFPDVAVPSPDKAARTAVETTA